MGDIDFDVNKVAVGVATHIYENAATGFSKAISGEIQKLNVAFKRGFASYVEGSLDRTCKVKTLLHPDESISLYDIYVPLTFKKGNELTTDQDIIKSIRSGKKVLVSGTAGGGKSVLIKHINVTLLRDFRNTLPVFFELRTLNILENDLLGALFDSLSQSIKSLTIDIFKDGLARGRFALILDGFDEVDHDRRDAVGEEIRSLASRFRKLSILVTTRPEEGLPGLQDFAVYHAQPMSKDQTIALLTKMDYDSEKKATFIQNVNTSLYSRHSEFLSNPLMTTMMLLTYSYYSDIPEKIHIFYQQAFETLYQRHDRSKGVYTRKSYTQLPIDDFQRVFEHFCAATYLAQRFSFDMSSAHKYIDAAINFCSIETSSDLFLLDLLESTCLLQRDGVYVSFVHRSFQEYFSAKFISTLGDAEYVRATNAVLHRAESDSTIGMLKAIDEGRFESIWALPTLRELSKVSKGDKSTPSPWNLCPEVFTKITVFPYGLTVNNSNTRLGQASFVFWQLYGIYATDPQISEDDVVAVVKAIKKNPTLSEEFISRASSQNIAAEIMDGESLYSKEGTTRVVSHDIISLSMDLRKALRTHELIEREMRAWIDLTDQIDQRIGSRALSLDEIFGATD